MSILTPEEQVGFHRDKGMKVLLYAGFLVLVGIAYYFWIGPWMRDAEGRVNALMYAYYQLFGIEIGAIVWIGLGAVVSLLSLKHFKEARRIKESLGNS